jgi:hypothetical protein
MTPTTNLPNAFRAAAHAFAEELRASFASGIPAQPEDQLKAPVQALLRAVKPQVFTRTEAQVHDLGGRPDIGVSVRQALCGYVELKAPGSGARTSRFRGRDKEQWEKFKALPNVLYTDSIEWALYRSGEQQPDVEPVLIRFDELIERGAAALDDDHLFQLHRLLHDFLSWQPIVPTDAPALAAMLAPLCRLLRADVLVAAERQESALHRLCGEIRDYLFPHATDAEFADIYAQTLTYALLLARLSGETELTTARAADRLDSGHGLLAETLRVLTVRAARDEIETPVSLLERVIGAVDPGRLARRGDPWLYFYEDFLAAYDPRLRRSYGVYYTPQQVIQCQVALAAELLIDRFEKPLTYADEDVIFLDSSAGTAAYPIAAIENGLRLVEARFGAGMLPAMATRCAQNVYGFELLVGPYAVAHLRLTNLLAAAGATLPEEGIHMYLTDTLESPHINPPQPPLMAERLTTEQRRARLVKDEVPVFICMGNPPYFREEGEADEPLTRGKWVRFGDPNERPILRDFTEPAGGHALNLYNLYVYFWRWTLWKMFENPNSAGTGIVSFITASSYLRGPGFVGMRQRMREAFDDLWIIDLEGDNLGARKTENVFAIQTPVCIAIGVRYAREKQNALARVLYARLTGTREEKYAKLDAIRSFADVQWRECFVGARDILWPTPPASWSQSPLLTDLWPWQGCGAKFERTWPIGENRPLLERRWQLLLEAPLEEKRGLFREDDDRQVDRRYLALRPPRNRLPPIADLDADTPPLEIVRYGFRSFDRRFAIADNRIGGRLNPSLWSVHSDSQTYITSLLTGVLGKGTSVVASANVPDLHHFRGSFGGRDVVPLWRDAAATRSNLPAGLLDVLGRSIGPVTPEDFFAYTYAVLSAPNYVEKFWEELTVPGPRIPVTCDAALYQRAVKLGRRLLWLHTFGERFVPEANPRGQIPRGTARCTRGIPTTPEGYPETVVWEDNRLRVGEGEFQPVPQSVWKHNVSDFFIVEGWVKSRLRSPTGRRRGPLDAIRPATWTADLTQELLEVLWVLEATIEMQPQLNALLADLLAGPLFAAADLPQPTAAERRPPGDEPDDGAQGELLIGLDQNAPN